MKKIFNYLNPFAHLGEKDYSFTLPLFTSLLISLLSELYALQIAKDPMSVGGYIIFINFATVIYFAFRSGIRGGLISTFIIILYYFYIIYDRNYTGQLFTSGIVTTLVLGSIYAAIALIIGYLKQNIDNLIEREADGKRRLEAIVDQMPVGVVITDSEGNILQTNKQFITILGRDAIKGTKIGQDTVDSITDFYHKKIPASQWPLAQALATGKSMTKKEYTLAKDNDNNTYLQVSASVIRNKVGKTIAAVSVVSDITQLKEIDKRKDEFINMASHELKTPLTSLRLYIDSLLKNRGSDQVKTLKSIKLQTEKLQQLIADLLDVSRIQTGKMIFSMDKFDINDLIKETIKDMQKTTTKHNIKFKNKGSLIVKADRLRINQVLTNLITNAIKFAPLGGNINILTKKTSGKITIAVQDQGIGITKDQLQKIFERLYQVSDAQEKTYPGLGMGLYISKEIIKRHNGKIWVESKIGKGSTFYFTLPLKN